MSVRQSAAGLVRSRRGVAALEFAIVGGFLSLLVVGIADFSLPLWMSMQVNNAARAGVEYAVLHGWSSSAVTAAAQHATQLPSTSVSVSPTEIYGCPSATNGIVTQTQGTNCSDGKVAGTYVKVIATATYTKLMPFSGLGGTVTLTGTAIARIL